LYGSKARGEATAESDIDLLVILDKRTRQNRVQVNKVASRVSLTFNALLLPQVVSWEQWQKMADAPFSFYREVFKDGLPVYGESSFFAPLLHHDVAPLVPIVAIA
jgi:predicted nucleotidyltransferase